jgi:hypothetical protein
MSDHKAIYYTNLDEILTKLQATEYPWMDIGQENKNIIISWCQDHDVTTIDFQTARVAIHNLGPGALESKKALVAPPPPPPPPPAPKAPRFDWYSVGAGEIPLEGPDGSTPPQEYLQSSSVSVAQLHSLVARQDKQRKPWLTDFTDKGSKFESRYNK